MTYMTRDRSTEGPNRTGRVFCVYSKEETDDAISSGGGGGGDLSTGDMVYSEDGSSWDRLAIGDGYDVFSIGKTGLPLWYPEPIFYEEFSGGADNASIDMDEGWHIRYSFDNHWGDDADNGSPQTLFYSNTGTWIGMKPVVGGFSKLRWDNTGSGGELGLKLDQDIVMDIRIKAININTLSWYVGLEIRDTGSDMGNGYGISCLPSNFGPEGSDYLRVMNGDDITSLDGTDLTSQPTSTDSTIFRISIIDGVMRIYKGSNPGNLSLISTKTIANTTQNVFPSIYVKGDGSNTSYFAVDYVRLWHLNRYTDTSPQADVAGSGSAI